MKRYLDLMSAVALGVAAFRGDLSIRLLLCSFVLCRIVAMRLQWKQTEARVARLEGKLKGFCEETCDCPDGECQALLPKWLRDGGLPPGAGL